MLALFSLCAALAAQPGGSPEERAIAHLIREVPAWARENHCFSCHNNGDGARALFLARAQGYAVPGDSLKDSLEWLKEPSRWDDGAKHPMASDTRLARIQFATALAFAHQLGEVVPRETLAQNARLLLREQGEDGAWRVETGEMPGSPITWGAVLATTLAIGVLESADSGSFAAPAARARQWLRRTQPANLLDSAALLLAFPGDVQVRSRILPRLLEAQTSDGGWGPQPRTPAETFDSAVVLLALVGLGPEHRPAEAIRRGRGFLLAQQLESGGWPETTRPSGNISYAHHISASAWATMALLRTHPER